MGIIFIIVVVVIVLVMIGKSNGNDSNNNTIILADPNEDPSFAKKWIEWKDGQISAYTKYTKSNETISIPLNGTYKMEGDKLEVYAKSSYLGSQGVEVKIGWVNSDNKIYFSNKDLVPHHNKYVNDFYNKNRSQWGDAFCDKQITEKQTKVNERLVAFVDGDNNIKTENGTVIGKAKGDSLEAAGVIIALFFEGWPPLENRFGTLCDFWLSEMSRKK